MARALCSLVLALAALSAAPAAACADAFVSLDQTIGILTITGDTAPDDIQVTQSSNSMSSSAPVAA